MSATAPSCPCVKRHSPPFWEGNRHHVVPESWGGQTVPSNLVDICMNTHGTVHHGLNALIHIAWGINKDGTITPKQATAALSRYPAYARALILRAVACIGGRLPHTYTTHLPGDHHDA
jgi:hypothetical protein